MALQAPTPALRAYSDPSIFRNDRVLRTLLRRELKLGAGCSAKTFYSSVQTEVKPGMRQEVASWMLGLCEEEGVHPQVFCLAINYLDRFLAVCNIRRSQLQLLASVCLLVSWKVRAHTSITAQKLVEFSDYNVSLEDILEWEFLLLSKLDWDLSAVIAPDFVEHILQRLLKLDLAWDIERTRTRVSTLVTLAYSHPSLAALNPSLLAASAILTALRPALETGGAMLGAPRDTPSPSSSSSCSSTSPIAKTSPSLATSSTSVEPLAPLLKAMERITGAQRSEVVSAMEQLEEAMAASLPPSPEISEDETSPRGARGQKTSSPKERSGPGGVDALSSPLPPRLSSSPPHVAFSPRPPQNLLQPPRNLPPTHLSLNNRRQSSTLTQLLTSPSSDTPRDFLSLHTWKRDS